MPAFAKRLGRRTLSISGELLANMFVDGLHPGYNVVRDGLPADAQIIEAQWDGVQQVIVLYITSAEYWTEHLTDWDAPITPELERVDG